MANHEVRIHLGGPDRRIEVDALERAAKNLKVLVSRPGSDVSWVVSELSMGSLGLAVRPSGPLLDDDLAPLDELDDALETFRHEQMAPVRWDSRRSRALLDLAKLTSSTRVDDVELIIGDHTYKIDASVERNVEQSLTEVGDRSSLGSIRGVVKRYNGMTHDVGIVDPASNRSVKATFGPELTNRIVELIEQEVIAWGEIDRDETGKKTSLHVHDIEVVSPSAPPAPVEEMVGIYGSDWTGGTPSEEWIRRQRE